MASRLLSRLSRRIAGAARPIGPSPPRPLPSAGAFRPTFAESEMTRSSRMPFVANSTLQRFGYSSSALSQPTTGASELSAQQVSGLTSGELAKLNYQKFSSSYTGYKKFLPYTLLFRWIEEIILDYVHHEVTRSMVMLYLRVFLIILMKDVFIDCYDLLTPEA